DYYQCLQGNGSAYSWNISGGTFKPGEITGQIIASWGDAGIGRISLTITNKYGCDTTITKTVVIAPYPIPVLSGKNNVCEFERGDIYSVANEPGSSFEWFVTGGSITGKNKGASINVNWAGAGTGNVQIKQTNSLGCDTIVQMKVAINPKPLLAIKGLLNVCEERGGYIYTTKAQPGTNYNWSVTGGILTADSANTIKVSWGKASAGTINLIAINTAGCESPDSIAVGIEPHPLSIIKSFSTVCIPAEAQFKFPPDSNIISDIWDFGDGITSNGMQASHQYKTPGDYTVMLITQNALGCTDTAYDLVKVYNSPKANFAINYPNPEKVLYNKEDLLVLVNKSK